MQQLPDRIRPPDRADLAAQAGLLALALAALAGLVAWQGPWTAAWASLAGLMLLGLLLAPRHLRCERMTLACFEHLDDLTRAGAHAARRAARRKRLLDLLQGDLDAWLYSGHYPAAIKPVRPGKWVRLWVDWSLWPRLDHVRRLRVRWTPLADVTKPDEFAAKLAGKLAQFLGVTPDELDVQLDLRRRRAHITRRLAAGVPAQLSAVDELTARDRDAG